MMKRKFWFVWNEGGFAPRYRHESESSAMKEADRLASVNPGSTFVILESIGEVIVPKRPTTFIEHVDTTQDEIPFSEGEGVPF